MAALLSSERLSAIRERDSWSSTTQALEDRRALLGYVDHLVSELSVAGEALRTVSKKAIAVRSTLDQPYPDDPHRTPWTRFLGPAVSRAWNLGCDLQRKYRPRDGAA